MWPGQFDNSGTSISASVIAPWWPTRVGRSRFDLAANHGAIRYGERDQITDPAPRLLADNGAEPSPTDCVVSSNELDPIPERLRPARADSVEFAVRNMQIACSGFAGQDFDSFLEEGRTVIVDLCIFRHVEHAVISGDE